MSMTSSNGGVKKAQVKLLKFNLGSFSGKVHEWQEFWDGFNSAIHKNGNLVNVDKMNYLKRYLEDKTKNTIAGIPTIDASYDSAVDLLKKRFGKSKQRAHVNELISVLPVYNKRNVKRLCRMQNEIEAHLCGLEDLSITWQYTLALWCLF